MAKLTEEDKKILKIREDAVKAWQPYITWLTSSERRQMRRRRVWDAAKWWISAAYNILTWLPHLASKFVTAPIDGTVWTNITWKVDDIVWYVPSKLRDSASDPKLFDNSEKIATIATSVGAMMAWWLGSSSRPIPNRLKTSNANDFIISQNWKVLYRNPWVSSNNPVNNFKSKSLWNPNVSKSSPTYKDIDNIINNLKSKNKELTRVANDFEKLWVFDNPYVKFDDYITYGWKTVHVKRPMSKQEFLIKNRNTSTKDLTDLHRRVYDWWWPVDEVDQLTRVDDWRRE